MPACRTHPRSTRSLSADRTPSLVLPRPARCRDSVTRVESVAPGRGLPIRASFTAAIRGSARDSPSANRRYQVHLAVRTDRGEPCVLEDLTIDGDGVAALEVRGELRVALG